jgi:hypothetical protein
MKITELNAPVQPDTYEASMLIKQAIRAGKYSIQIHNLLSNDQEVEAWVQKKIDLATNYVKKIAKYLELEGQYGEDAGEGHMAKSQLYHSAKYAMQIAQTVRPGDDIEAWVQTKMNKAVDMLDAVYHYEDYQRMNPYREDLGDEHAKHGLIIQKKIDEILDFELPVDDIETKPGMFNILKKRVNEFEKEMSKKLKSKVDERMPASVIKHKQKLAYMTDKELANHFKDKDDETLKQMAWRHGYGKMSPHYVNRKNKGMKEDTISESPRAVGRALANLKYAKAMANGIMKGEDMVLLRPKAQAFLGSADETIELLDKMYSPVKEEQLDEGIRDWAKKLAMAGVVVAGLAGVGSINDAINNSVPAVKAMNTAYEMAVDQGHTELADQIKKDISAVKVRLDSGRDLNFVKDMQDKYAKFMKNDSVNEYSPFKNKVLSKLKAPVDLIKQKQDQEAYRDKMKTLQNISKNKHTPYDQELKDKLASRLDKLRSTGL